MQKQMHTTTIGTTRWFLDPEDRLLCQGWGGHPKAADLTDRDAARAVDSLMNQSNPPARVVVGNLEIRRERVGQEPAHHKPCCGGEASDKVDAVDAVVEPKTATSTASVVPEDIASKMLELCAVLENRNDLPPVKWGLRAGRLVNEVRAMLAAQQVGV